MHDSFVQMVKTELEKFKTSISNKVFIAFTLNSIIVFWIFFYLILAGSGYLESRSDFYYYVIREGFYDGLIVGVPSSIFIWYGYYDRILEHRRVDFFIHLGLKIIFVWWPARNYINKKMRI